MVKVTPESTFDSESALVSIEAVIIFNQFINFNESNKPAQTNPIDFVKKQSPQAFLMKNI